MAPKRPLPLLTCEGTKPEGLFVSDELHGDVLEAVVSHVSPLDLLPTSLVSKSWRRAVLSSLRSSPRPAPRLLIHQLRSHRRATSNVNTHAYDPRARAWVSFPLMPSDALREDPLRCAHPGGRLYALNSSRLAVSTDPFRSAWREMEAPRVWRTDPVVAAVGRCVVVAGGVSEFEDDPRAVEVYRDGSGWRASESMPEEFAGSTSASWLSVASSDRRLYVMEKNLAPSGGWLSWFDPVSGRWGPTRRLRFPSAGEVQLAPAAIGYVKSIDRLVVVGVAVGTTSSCPEAAVAIWTVDEETLEVEEEIGRMPKKMAEESFTVAWEGEDVGFCCDEGFGYVYKRSYSSSSIPEEFFLCEFEKSDGRKNKSCCRRWERVAAPETLQEEMAMHGVVIRCSMAGSGDLGTALSPPATV